MPDFFESVRRRPFPILVLLNGLSGSRSILGDSTRDQIAYFEAVLSTARRLMVKR